MRVLIPLLVLADVFFPSCTPMPVPEPVAAGDREVVGRVTAIDFGPMAYDADGRILLALEEGGTAAVLVPARSNLCQAEGLAQASQAEVGDRLLVRGSVVQGGVLPCADPAHVFLIID